ARPAWALSPGSTRITCAPPCRASPTSEAAGSTRPEVPTTNSKSDPRIAAWASDQVLAGKDSPNHTTPGRTSPSQLPQRGGSNRWPVSIVCSAGTSNPVNGRLQPEQRSFISSPRRCSTRDEPARSCRSATFCVTTLSPGHLPSSSASTLCPACGWTLANCAIRYTYQPQTSDGSRWNAVGVASSSGFQRDHRLSLPPRNVGIPLSADMPAPVNTTGRWLARSAATAAPTTDSSPMVSPSHP